MDFSVNPTILKFFIFNPIPFFKVTKFLVKISQFKLLVMIERPFWFINFFYHYIFEISVYFLLKNFNPLKKVFPFTKRSLNLHFLKFDESFTFFSNSIIFFFDFSSYAVAQKCCLQQSWAWYDPGTWQLCESWQGKSLFTEPYNFRHDSWKIDLELVELGS